MPPPFAPLAPAPGICPLPTHRWLLARSSGGAGPEEGPPWLNVDAGAAGAVRAHLLRAPQQCGGQRLHGGIRADQLPAEEAAGRPPAGHESGGDRTDAALQ
eukprot:6125457-Pyramimonas_sp.AAC.1